MTNTPSIYNAATLRQCLIDDMNLHRLSRATQHNYLRDLTWFANWLGRPPDLATDEDLRRYQIEQHETGLGAVLPGPRTNARFALTNRPSCSKDNPKASRLSLIIRKSNYPS